MSYRRVLAAVLAALSLAGCVGIIFPIPAERPQAGDDGRNTRR